MEQKNQKIGFPSTILAPLVSFLRGEEKKLKDTKKKLKKEDPFVVGNRDNDNSVDSDVAENVEHDRAFAMRKLISKSIISIKKTLTRIKLGKYGICTSCGKMIDTDRLSIKPTAEFCIDCEIKKNPSAIKKCLVFALGIVLLDWFLQLYFRGRGYGVFNLGISFGMGSGLALFWKMIPPVGFGLLIAYEFLVKKKVNVYLMCLGIGGLGNFLPRLVYGNVWDYLHLWPLGLWINMSDVLISISVLSYILIADGDTNSI